MRLQKSFCSRQKSWSKVLVYFFVIEADHQGLSGIEFCFGCFRGDAGGDAGDTGIFCAGH